MASADEKAADPKLDVSRFRSDKWSNLSTRAIVPSGPGADARQAVIEIEVRYRNPGASDVLLVWGLDNFTRVPACLPSETFLTHNGSHLNTPMQRDGNVFVARFDVEPDTRLDFAFTIRRTSAGNVSVSGRGPTAPENTIRRC